MTSKNIYDLDNMNVAAQNVALGTNLNKLLNSEQPTITELNEKQIYDLNNMNVVAQYFKLGDIINALYTGNTEETADLTPAQQVILNNINVAAQDAKLGEIVQEAIDLSRQDDRYKLTVNPNDTTMGTVTGGGIIKAGNTVQLSATALGGYNFVNWTKGGVVLSAENPYTYTMPAQATTVIGNFEEVQVDPIFGNNTPDVISNISNQIATNGYTSAQVASIYGWNLGDLIDITLKNNETIQMQIIGINHDTLSSDHTTKAGITLQMKNCLNTTYSMNDTDTNAGGWGASKMRNSTMPTLLALLPDEWQAVIKNVDKKAANGGGENYSATNTTSESLFLLAEIEIFGSESSYAQDSANEGTQYEYWAQHNTSADRIKNISGSSSSWWERSSYYNSPLYFCGVSNVGSADYYGTSIARGVAFGFCV